MVAATKDSSGETPGERRPAVVAACVWRYVTSERCSVEASSTALEPLLGAISTRSAFSGAVAKATQTSEPTPPSWV
jgi:hypothetical protein